MTQGIPCNITKHFFKSFVAVRFTSILCQNLSVFYFMTKQMLAICNNTSLIKNINNLNEIIQCFCLV